MRTLGSPFLALLLQGQGGAASESSSSQILDLARSSRRRSSRRSSSLILALFSIVSLGDHPLQAAGRSGAPTRQSAQFLDVFRRSSKFSEVQAVCRSLGESPLVGLFQAGYAELTASCGRARRRRRQPANPRRPPRPTLKSLDGRRSRAAARVGVEVNKLEQRVPFLATTASITPFIGLFGTVWGIMMAFQGIGADRLDQPRRRRRRASPRRSIATAAGLVAAIPAVYLLQPPDEPREAVRVGDGRLRDGVPEHRRAELHLDAESPGRAADARRRTARPRPPRRRARSPRSTSCRWST